eukprot:NODE_1741_length_899_cov_362.396471_g1214_i0.p1 GENE.NODE_1741_length_899_cov_362.396471_g1214_i0~~NODE_1741_length_899_cov_362.396471_g1214_i0.p1  ORF type:complete len:237 (-),score=60.56 NODE_1741_length_899_cov_362.396471_g1214_i0:50-760(-)
MPLELYWVSGSLPCWRVMLALEQKRIPYKSTRLTFASGYTQTPEFLALNPRGQVPTLVDDDGDVVLYESLAILHYLERRYSSSGEALMPADEKAAALVLMRAQESENLARSFETVYQPLLFQPKAAWDVAALKGAVVALKEEVGRWELYAKRWAYIAGEDFSLADCAVYPYIAFLCRVGFDLASFPYLSQYNDLVEGHTCVHRSWPPHWKETVGRNIFEHLAEVAGAASPADPPRS